MNKTISDEECRDTLIYDVFAQKDDWEEWEKKDVFGKPSDTKLISLFSPLAMEEFDKRNQNPPTLGERLTIEDAELLEEYAPKIFNTIPEPNINLNPYLHTLTILIRSYRRAELQIKLLEEKFNAYNASKSNKGEKEKIRLLRKRLNDIVNLIGEPSHPDAAKYIFPALQKLYYEPQKYISRNPKYTISKSPILDFLRSLKLPGKSQIIEEFYKKI